MCLSLLRGLTFPCITLSLRMVMTVAFKKGSCLGLCSVPTSYSIQSCQFYFAIDNDNCDVHIINEGITADGTSGVVMFEGTAPAATIPQSTFQCSVSDLSGTILLDQMNLECKFQMLISCWGLLYFAE